MRKLAAMLMGVSLLASGCSALGSRDREPERRPRQPESREREKDQWWLDGAEASRPKSKATEAASWIDRNSIIAGIVVDARDQEILKGRTFISVRDVNDNTPVSGKGGTGVESDTDGSFYMEGLVPGKTYVLQAVREVDGRKIAAEAMVKPPSANIRLELHANKVSSLTPPPHPPATRGPFETKNDSANLLPPTSAGGPDRGWEPGGAPPTSSLPPPPAASNVKPENIAAGALTHVPPTAAIRPPPTPAQESARKFDEVPATRLPGQKVPNFRLADMTGRDWEFQYAHGRLILMDFWGTHCTPCMNAIPAMKQLQANYGASGLEVVAVACEQDAPIETRIRNVDEKARQKQVNYPVYVERDGKVGDVQRLFNVQFLPTLVLLDNKGNILWRGGATATDMTRLEEFVKNYLTKR